MQICPVCGSENPDQLTICLTCASTLVVSPPCCPACGRPSAAGGRYCQNCGAALEQPPASPSGEAPPASLSRQERMLREFQNRMPEPFKSKVAASLQTLAGQRREVTVLRTRIFNYDGLLAQLDSEHLYLLMDKLLLRLAELVHRYEGVVDTVMDDGLLALFGLPVNHENDPERAVRASLDMQAGLQALVQATWTETTAAPLVALQTGMHTGLVIAGSPLPGSPGVVARATYTAVGDTVKLASQLAGLAEPGSIYVSFPTYQRTNPVIEYAQPQSHKVYGLAQPILAYRPLAIRRKPGPTRGLPGLQASMVGRREDLERLLQAWDDLKRQSRPLICFIQGEAGMGKSRLVEEFRKTADLSASQFALASCSMHMRITPYRVVANLIRQILQISESDPPEVQISALRQYLDRQPAQPAPSLEALPYLLHVLDLPQLDPTFAAQLKVLSPEMLERQIHTALRAFLLADGFAKPQVIVCDDLHWVDPASANFLGFLAQALETEAVLLILVARNFSEPPELATLADLAQRTADRPQPEAARMDKLSLQPLSTAEMHQLLLELVAGETDPALESLRQRVVERASGNPYYAEELVRMLMDLGGLQAAPPPEGVAAAEAAPASWQVTGQADELLRSVPGTLSDIILARFDRLPEQQRQLLQQLAVLGDIFSERWIRILVDLPAATLETELANLASSQFLAVQETEIEAGKGAPYRWKHPLIQATIHSTLTRQDRQRLHHRVAQAVEAGYPYLPADRIELLALHYAESPAPEKALVYLLQAAENALLRSANRPAAEHFTRLLELSRQYYGPSLYPLWRIQIGLGKALKFLGEFAPARAALEAGVKELTAQPLPALEPTSLQFLVDGLSELADLLARQGELEQALELLQQGTRLLGETGYQRYPQHWRRLADRIAWVYFRQGRLEEAFRQADLALLEINWLEEEDPIVIASLNNTLGGIYWTRSHYQEALRCVERSLEIYSHFNYAWGMAIALTNMGVLNFSLENWELAAANFERADLLRVQYGYSLERPTNLKNLGELLLCQGQFEQARQVLETSRLLGRRLGLPLAVTYAEIGLARLALAQSDPEALSAHLQAAQEAMALEGKPASEAEARTDRGAQVLELKAHLLLQRNDPKGALEIAYRGYRIAQECGFSREEADLLRVLGLIQRQLGDPVQAVEELNASLRIAEGINDHYRQGLALLELGQATADTSADQAGSQPERLRQARQLLQRAAAFFEKLGAQHLLEQARQALTRLPALAPAFSRSFGVQPAAMPEAAVLPAGEWRRVVTLCVKLAPRPDEDPELIFEVYALLLPGLIGLAQENGGLPIQQPDQLLILFGAPQAHEDDPTRAVETAMQIANDFYEVSSQIHAPVTLQMGIALGPVVAGSVGDGLSYRAQGEPVREAQALAAAAAAAGSSSISAVWVSEEVRRATAYRFAYQPVGEAEQVAFLLSGLAEQIQPVRGLIGVHTPFIGRLDELQTLLSFSSNLDQQRGGLVWIEGEAGMGKSRLLREFAQRLSPRPLQIFSGACSSRQTERAFGLFTDLLYHIFMLSPELPPPLAYDQIDRMMATWPEALLEARPFLELLLGLRPRPDPRLPTAEILSLEPEQLRRQIFVQVRRFFGQLAGLQPLVLLLDDLHWVDSVSADLLIFLSQLVVTHPFLMVCTQRLGEATPNQGALERLKDMLPELTRRLTIHPFNEQESFRLLDALLVKPAQAGETGQVARKRLSRKTPPARAPGVFLPGEREQELAQVFGSENLSLIIRQSGGNPYFIEEFIRMLLEQQVLRLSHGRLEVYRPFQADQLKVPASLEALIRTRVDSLPDQARKLIQSASILGFRFSIPVLDHVAQVPDLRENLALLQERNMVTVLVRSDAPSLWLPDACEFSHPLIETIVYGGILRAQRQVLHARAAQALEREWAGHTDEHAEELAYHLLRARLHSQAIPYLILAGDKAYQRYANEEALSYYEQANELLLSQPEIDRAWQWQIATGLGTVYLFIGNYAASLEALQASLALAEEGGLSAIQHANVHRLMGEARQRQGESEAALRCFEQAREALGEPADPPSWAEAAVVAAREGWTYFQAGNFERAEAACSQALTWGDLADNLSALASVENTLGGIFYRQGNFEQALHHTHRAMLYWERLGYTWGVAANLGNQGILEVTAGNWERAQQNFQRSLELCQEMGDVEGVARLENNLGMLALLRGDLAHAEACFRHSLAVARPLRIAYHSANSSLGLAQTLLYMGDPDLAQRTLNEGLATANEAGLQDLTAEMSRAQAEIHLARGAAGPALLAARAAVDQARRLGERVVEASAWRILAYSHLLQAEFDQADQALQAAWQALADGVDELETGRLHALAAQLAQRRGQPENAHFHTEWSRAIFTRLGAQRDLDLLDAQG